jgi:hypothetical protein
MFFVSTYNPEKALSELPQFYIQSKGLNAGRPLREPKRNSWAIYTDIDFAFEILTVLWVSKTFDQHLCGSVIPFLRIHDFKKIVLPYLTASHLQNETINSGMKTISTIDALIVNTQSKLKLIKALRISTAAELLNNFQTNTSHEKKNAL